MGRVSLAAARLRSEQLQLNLIAAMPTQRASQVTGTGAASQKGGVGIQDQALNGSGCQAAAARVHFRAMREERVQVL